MMTEAERDSKFLKQLDQCHTKGDLERLLYDHSNGRLSRADCKTLISKTFKFLEKQAEQERAMKLDLWGAVAGWAKAICGKA